MHVVIKTICRWKMISRTQKNKKPPVEKEKTEGGSSSGIFRVVPHNHHIFGAGCKGGMCLRKARQSSNVVYVHWAAAAVPRCCQHIANDLYTMLQGNCTMLTPRNPGGLRNCSKQFCFIYYQPELEIMLFKGQRLFYYQGSRMKKVACILGLKEIFFF